MQRNNFNYIGEPIRPPAEADSAIVQATIGCPHSCEFCGAYRRVSYSIRSDENFRKHLEWLSCVDDSSKNRIFFADGDTMILSTEKLLNFISNTQEFFPSAKRFSLYSGAGGIINKSISELESLKRAGLNTFYMGLESGAEEILHRVKKACTATEMIEAVKKAQSAGIRASVIVILGLGGQDFSKAHIHETALTLNLMQPRLLSALTLMLVPNTPLYKSAQEGMFQLPDANGILLELQQLIEELELERTV
ncbi:MAG: radical SAM protein, partial [Candidatus Riflebacteria bacterium]|nr:radical SAM protein [Candidatus Riflebacteria bacterium]